MGLLRCSYRLSKVFLLVEFLVVVKVYNVVARVLFLVAKVFWGVVRAVLCGC